MSPPSTTLHNMLNTKCVSLEEESIPLASLCIVQVWIKPNGEMPFLYGNHVLKAHLGRITEDTPEHQGVVVYSMNDIPLASCFVF